MASLQNSFDLLEAQAQGKGQGRKKNKNKGGGGSAATEGQPTHQQHQENDFYQQGGASASQHELTTAPYEAWERAAREHKSTDSRQKLWKEWIAKAHSTYERYKSSSGTVMDFRTALLESRGLELSVEGSVLAGGQVDTEQLARLLSTFLHFPGDLHGATSLASTLARLSALLEGELPDTRGAASRAVQGIISTLKSSPPNTDSSSNSSAANHALFSWINRISSIDKQIQQQQAALSRLAATGAVTKEHAATAKAIFKLVEEKFSMLQPANLPAASGSKPASAAVKQALTNLADLESLVNGRLQEALGGNRVHSKGGNQQSGSASSAQGRFKREEMLLSQQSEQVAAQIRTLEAQLRSLCSQQAELADKTAQLRQQQANTFDTVSSKSKGSKGQVAGASSLGVAHFQEELAAIQALSRWANLGAQQGSEQVTAVQAASSSLPMELMAAGQNYLGTALGALVDLPNKVAFCRQRLHHAEKLIKLGAKDQEKAQRDAEKLLEDTLKGADEMMQTSVQVLADMNQRYEAIVLGAPEHASAASAAIQSAEALVADIRVHHAQLQLSSSQPLTMQQPPTHPQQQQQQQQRGQGRGRGNQNYNQQQQQQQGMPAPASSPRTPGAAPRQPAPVSVPYSSASTPPAQAQQQDPAPVTPAPVPVTAPVVPHDHMHAPPPIHAPLAPPTIAPSNPQPPACSSEVLAANGGFEPATPPVPMPAAATHAVAGAAAVRPGSAARQPVPRPASAQHHPASAPRTESAAAPPPAGGSAFDTAAQILAGARMQQQLAPERPMANGRQPQRPSTPSSAGAAAAPTITNPVNKPAAPAAPPRSWAKPAPVEQEPAAGWDDLPPTPAEAARLAASVTGNHGAAKEDKPQQQDAQPQPTSGKGDKKRTPRA